MKRLLAMLLLLACAGCGYQVPGRGGELPGGVKAIYLPLFTNRTLKPRLENSLTDAVAEVLSRVASIRLVADQAQADTVVEGTILSYGSAALSYGQNDAIREYGARMAVDIKLRRTADGKLLWQQRLDWQEPYLTDTDKSVQTDLEDAAILEVERRLAEEFLFRLLADF
jgi:outer membrane lipopolysaccharide assembly protein LptE/RlpB